MPQEQKNTTFDVMFDVADMSVYQVTAAYTSIDERMFPGWALFKDENGAIAAKVRSERTLMIRRADSDPAPARKMAAPQPQITITGGPPGQAPSPAQMAALAGKMSAVVQRGTI